MVKFSPVAYDHAAYLIGKRPWEVSRNADLLINSHNTAIKRYNLEECLVGIDIYNVEAEALGCHVLEPDGMGSPTIESKAYFTHEDVSRLDLDAEHMGRCPMILETATTLKKMYPKCSVRIPVCGPFTLTGHLLGLNNLLCDIALDVDKTLNTLQYVSNLLLVFIESAYRRSIEVTVFESAASPPLLSPKSFQTTVSPVLSHLFNEAESRYHSRPEFIIGGNTYPILESLLDLRPSFLICPFETDQFAFIESIAKSAVQPSVRVNMNPSVFNGKTPDKALQEAERTLQLATLLENSSIGTILPYDANPLIVEAVAELVTRRKPIK